MAENVAVELARILLEYLTTSGAKYDVIFLLGDPDFL